LATLLAVPDNLASNVVWDGLTKGDNRRDLLRNHDLSIAVGKTFQELLQEAAKKQIAGHPSKEQLGRLSTYAGEAWFHLNLAVEHPSADEASLQTEARRATWAALSTLREDRLIKTIIEEGWPAGMAEAQPIDALAMSGFLRRAEISAQLTLEDVPRELLANWMSINFAGAFKETMIADQKAQGRAWTSLQLSFFSHVTKRLTDLPKVVAQSVKDAVEEAITRHIKAMNARDLEWTKQLVDGLTKNGGPLADLHNEIQGIRRDLEHRFDRIESKLFGPTLLRRAALMQGNRYEYLIYKERITPLLERDDTMATLEQWCDDPAEFSSLRIIGPGGVGKSRLGLEWTEEMLRLGWHAGFLASDSTGKKQPWIDDADRYENWEPTRPTAIVIDYANRFAERVPALLQRLAERARLGAFKGTRVRILLLDRPDATGTALFQTRRDPRTAGQHTQYGAAFGGQAPIILAPLSAHSTRLALLRACLRARRKYYDFPAEADPFWARVERISLHGRPLLLMIYGLALADDPKAALSIESATDLLDWDLVREFRHWRDVAKRTSGDAEQRFRQLAWLVAVTTYCHGLATSSLSELRLDDGSVPEKDLLQDLADILGYDEHCLPDGQRTMRLQPLQPDGRAIHYLDTAGRIDYWDGNKNVTLLPLFDKDRASTLAFSLDRVGSVNTVQLSPLEDVDDLSRYLEDVYRQSALTDYKTMRNPHTQS